MWLNARSNAQWLKFMR